MRRELDKVQFKVRYWLTRERNTSFLNRANGSDLDQAIKSRQGEAKGAGISV